MDNTVVSFFASSKKMQCKIIDETNGLYYNHYIKAIKVFHEKNDKNSGKR